MLTKQAQSQVHGGHGHTAPNPAFLPMLFTFWRMCTAFSFILGFAKVLGSRRAGVCYKDCSCVKWQAVWAARKHRCQAQLQCPNASKMLRRAFYVREETESLPPGAEAFSLCSGKQAVLSFGLWFLSDTPEWLPPRVSAVRAWVRGIANPTVLSGCGICHSVLPSHAESLFHKRGFFWTCQLEFILLISLHTAETGNWTPFSLGWLEGKSIFFNGCSHCWPPDFSPWLCS